MLNTETAAEFLADTVIRTVRHTTLTLAWCDPFQDMSQDERADVLAWQRDTEKKFNVGARYHLRSVDLVLKMYWEAH